MSSTAVRILELGFVYFRVFFVFEKPGKAVCKKKEHHGADNATTTEIKLHGDKINLQLLGKRLHY